ncbi:MAG TPA: metallophosphoesterase [Candidatus Bathyarchaeia archaeon]|nr:metallophosphoesterase [Candidatus Bathyarchaeia archaeon]
MKCACLLLVIVVAGFAVAASAEPVIPRSLARLEQAPALCDSSFDFIVAGDTQSNRQLAYQTDLFRGMIREWNVLKPAFVIEVGDLILGGSADGVPVQWDLFEETIAACEPPYLPVPGNHDINDSATERMWQDRLGPPRYSFRYGNSRFIALDSEEVDALDRLSDEQVAWFKDELERSKEANVFVFLHQPYWSDEDDPRNSEATWERRWKYLAEVMRGHPVRVVFAGHDHRYRYFGRRDGVHYVIAAGGASMNGPEAEGKFSHYVLVKVRGEEVSWAVIKPGSVLAPDVSTVERAAEVADIERRLVSCPETLVKVGEGFDRDVVIRVENPFDKGFDSTMAWDVPEGWNVEPASMPYVVVAQGQVEMPFRVWWTGQGEMRLPAPSYKTSYANTSFGEPYDVKVEMPVVPTADAPRSPGEVRLDGMLEEWAQAAPVRLNYVFGFDGGTYQPANISGTCRAMWDDGNLYLAFELEDDTQFQPYAGDIVWLADCIELSVSGSAWGFSLTKAGPEVFYYLGAGLSAETVNKDVRLAVRRDGGRTTYEAAFPARVLPQVKLTAGSSFVLGALVSDVDAEGGKKHELALTPDGVTSGGVKMTLR